MAYLFPVEDNDIFETVKEFCEKEIKEKCKEYDRSGEWPREIYEKIIEMGLHMMDIPEKLGGPGFSAITSLALMEQIAKADAGVASTLMGNALASKAVLIAGNDAQQKAMCTCLENGGLGAFALTEPNAGSDAAAGKVTAVRDGDFWVLNGRKCFITSGNVASFYVVTAMTAKNVGVKGMSAFYIDAGTPGLSAGHEEDKMGIRTSNTCDVILDNCRIPAENLLGAEGEGFKIAMKTLDKGRMLCACVAAGVAQRCIDEAVEYGKQRIAFGKPILSNQALRFKIADMAIRTECARQMAAHCAELMSRGLPYSTEAAAAKAFAGDTAVYAAEEAIQIFGGYGYSREYPVEKLLRDAKIFQIYEGTGEIMRIVVSNAAIGK